VKQKNSRRLSKRPALLSSSSNKLFHNVGCRPRHRGRLVDVNRLAAIVVAGLSSFPLRHARHSIGCAVCEDVEFRRATPTRQPETVRKVDGLFVH